MMIGNPSSTKISSHKPIVNISGRQMRAYTGHGFFKDQDST